MVGEPKPEGDPNRDPSRSGPQHPLHHRRLPLSRRQLLMQGVVAVVILGSGVGIGTGGTVLALKNRIVTGLRLLPVGPPGPEPNVIAARWKGEYGLSDKQEQQVKDILTKQFTALRELRQKLFQTEQSEREKSTTSLKKVLTSEQYAKWDQDMKERARRFEQMRASRGPRGDHKGPPRGDRGPGRPMDPNGHRGGWPRDRFVDPNGHRIDGPPRPPTGFDSRRGDGPPPPLMGPEDRHKGDRPPDRPMEINSRPGEVNTPK